MEGGMMDSASSLMRLKSRLGIKQGSASKLSGYIALCKIKRALKEEFTKELFKMYMRQNNIQKKRWSHAGKIDRWNVKLDRLDPNIVKYMYQVYDADGIMALVRVLETPVQKLVKAIEKMNNQDL